MIIEGIVTTLNRDGSPHPAAMGAIFPSEDDRRSFLLRPFYDTVTYANLERSRCGVFHVTDDILLFARLVASRRRPRLEYTHAERVTAPILATACDAYEFVVESIGPHDNLRSQAHCRTVASRHLRPFAGFNRARHALLELAIAATRLHILPEDQVLEELRRAELLVAKTGGRQERDALQLLQRFVLSQLDSPATHREKK